MKYIRLIKSSQIVYHGSPYKFENFDLNKVGKGDGNKYGWGIYFTSDSKFGDKYGQGKEYYDGKEITDVYISLYIPDLLKGKKKEVMKETKNSFNQVYEFAKNFDASKYERKKGYVYKVEIPSDNELLNYDLPYDQQPQKSKLNNLIKDYKIVIDENTYGVNLYIKLAKKLGSKKAASLALSKYDIPGLTYEENEKNYVIWDTNRIKIIK